MPTLAKTLSDKQQFLRQWLFDHALPLWWDIGGDKEKGGFYEKINLDGKPSPATPRPQAGHGRG